MSPRVAITQPADPGTTIAPGAFDSQIGKTVPMNIEGHPIEGGCKILAAQVADDGTSVSLTVEVPDGSLPQTPRGSFSISQ